MMRSVVVSDHELIERGVAVGDYDGSIFTGAITCGKRTYCGTFLRSSIDATGLLVSTGSFYGLIETTDFRTTSARTNTQNCVSAMVRQNWTC